ncbi:YjcZ family sporulation protein [Lysinibacillus sp. NPDC097231]
MAYYGAGTGSNFALSIVLFILLVIAGVGLWYLLRTLIYTNNL